jgi:long-chain acyl-CoA synthetase
MIVDVSARLGIGYAAFLSAKPDTDPRCRSAGDVLSYTSGTTGRPKAVMRPTAFRSPEDACRPLVNWYAEAFGIKVDAPGCFLNACPAYIAGPLTFLTYSLHLGRTVVLMPGWDPRIALWLITQHSVTETYLVPYQMQSLIRHAEDELGKLAATKLRTVIHGSSPCPAAVKRAMLDWLGDIVHECYGATEIGGTVALAAESRERPGTVGRAQVPREVRILDAAGTECPANVIGTVYMRQLEGAEFWYKNDEARTNASRCGVFATVGDRGYCDAAGYLFLCGRDSDAINIRGQKVNPWDVEHHLARAGVTPSLVIVALPHETWGEEIGILVEETFAEEKMGELLQHIATLPYAMRPTRLIRCKTFHYDATGKLDRRTTVAEALANAIAASVPLGGHAPRAGRKLTVGLEGET